MKESRITSGVLAALIGGVSLVLCFMVLARAIVRVKSSNEIIRVTGSARRPIHSDLIVWKSRISLRAKTVTEAYTSLQRDTERVRTYLIQKGIPEKEIFPSAVETKTLYVRIMKKNKDGTVSPDPSEGNETEQGDTFRPIAGYQLSQEIEVRSAQVDKVDEIARKVTELISQGVSLESMPPKYIYTKLSDMKVTMLAEAAKDARSRADQIAQSSGCQVGDVRFARMGVLQITPIYSTEVSSEGINDTSSLDKDITAIVSMGFSIR